MLSNEPWFGKKTEGWGARPISWHGWMCCIVYVTTLAGLLLILLLDYQYFWIIELLIIVVTGLFIFTALATSGDPTKFD